MSPRTRAEPLPTVPTDTDAMDAARAMAAGRLPGLIVCTDDGRPYTVLPDSQVLRFLIPAYLQDEPGLARALDERASDEMCRKLERSTVGDLLHDRQDLDELPVVDGGATALGVAAVMARMHRSLVAVAVDGLVVGAIPSSRLLNYLLPPAVAP